MHEEHDGSNEKGSRNKQGQFFFNDQQIKKP